MNSDSTVYFDTSAVIDYIIKQERRVVIDAETKEYTKRAALHYVKMEIKRGALQYFVYLHNKLVQCASYAEVQTAISNLAATPQRHRLGTILEAIASFWSDVGNSSLDALKKAGDGETLDEYVRRRCISYIRMQSRRLWNQIDVVVDATPNPMACFADIDSPRMKGGLLDNNPSRCPGSRVECQIRNFFVNNRDDVEAILRELETIKGADEETTKRRQSLRDILRLLPYAGRGFSNYEPNVKACWSSGDAIIAIGTPRGSVLLNGNPKHMDDICQAAGRISRTYMARKGKVTT